MFFKRYILLCSFILSAFFLSYFYFINSLIVFKSISFLSIGQLKCLKTHSSIHSTWYKWSHIVNLQNSSSRNYSKQTGHSSAMFEILFFMLEYFYFGQAFSNYFINFFLSNTVGYIYLCIIILAIQKKMPTQIII